MKQNSKDLIYLCACAVNEIVPEHVETMDLDGIFAIAARHLLLVAVSFALQSAGVQDPQIQTAIASATRKAVILDHEKAALCERLEEAGIWYMPLKGAILKDYYPKLGMREMSDYDIFYDAACSEELRAIMEDFGFSTERFETFSHHDVFFQRTRYDF